MSAKATNRSLRAQLSLWFTTALGEKVLAQEQELLDDVLPNLFGYHIVQCGYPNRTNMINASRIGAKSILYLDKCEFDSRQNGIGSLVEDMPIAADSVDVMVLPHVLEYSKDPHRLLREIGRVLIDDGHVIIIGINRFSLWGIWHLCCCWWNRMPWSGRLISIPRMKDWLSLLDFEIRKTYYCFYSPPVSNPKWLKKCLPIERLGRLCWPIFGGIYVIVGKKRIVPLNPIKMQWKSKRKLVGTRVVEPSTQTSNRVGKSL